MTDLKSYICYAFPLFYYPSIQEQNIHVLVHDFSNFSNFSNFPF